ncbi:FIST C-domain [Trinorchestia longiramus]|nr:FIST C-domain [Trinorchestia longiramus]
MSCEAELSSKIGILLSNNIEIAQIVLHQLPVLDLIRLQWVCRLWRTLAAKELASRQLQFFSTTDRDDVLKTTLEAAQEKREFECWKQHWRSKPSFCFHFYDLICNQDMSSEVSEKLVTHLPQTCPVLEVPCFEGMLGTRQLMPHGPPVFRDHLSVCASTFCPNLQLTPLHVTHTSSNLSPNSKRRGSEGEENGALGQDTSSESEEAFLPPTKVKKTEIPRRQRRPRAASAKALLPGVSTSGQQSCSSLIHDNEALLAEVASRGCGLCKRVLSANVGASSAFMVEIPPDRRDMKRDKMAVLCLPAMHNVTYRRLTVQSKEPLGGDAGYRTWNGCLPETDQPKAILLFNGPNIDLHSYVKHTLMREGGQVAVVGGQLTDSTSEYFDVEMCGVAVCGKGVTAASTVLGQELVTVQQVVKAFKEFEVFYNASKQSAAFFITCVGRPQASSSTRQMAEKEVNIFRSLYPTTPVFGCFTFGETCHKFIPYNVGSKEWSVQERLFRRRIASNNLEFYHTYSTVVLFLQFG